MYPLKFVFFFFFKLQISLIGLKPSEELEIKTKIDEKTTSYNITLQRIVDETPLDFLMCTQIKSEEDSLISEVSFHPECTVKHLEVNNV